MNSKAQGLPLNTIVIALLVVVVLVVIVLAFTTNIGETNQTFQEMSRSCSVTCSSFGGEGVAVPSGGSCSMSTYKIGEIDCCCGEISSSGSGGSSNGENPTGVDHRLWEALNQ